jgi:uncharacterized protein with HEPN domain
MCKRPVVLLIEDIWEAIEKIERYTSSMPRKSFEEDEKTTDAVVRNLEIIGEAANRLPDSFKGEHAEIEWIIRSLGYVTVLCTSISVSI